MVPILVPMMLRSSISTPVAATPPMGWNSYDCFGSDANEKQVLDNAKVMAAHLKSAGWQYVVIDYRWYSPDMGPQFNWNVDPSLRPAFSMDGYGRLQPDPKKFPSSAGGKGFKELASKIHSLGLKFGLHLMRGIPEQAVAANDPILGSKFHAPDVASTVGLCSWFNLDYSLDMSKPGAQQYLDSVFDQYADWGVDFVKVDDITNPYHAAEIEGYRKAIQQCGRNIVLSLSPGPTPFDEAADVSSKANMWRTLIDLWDRWSALDTAFDAAKLWNAYRGPGHWPDLDMLPMGRLRVSGPETGPADSDSRLTEDEEKTMLTLWSITKSPLMFGGDLTQTSRATLALIENADVTAADQDGSLPTLLRDGDYPVWAATAKTGEYFAVFNRTDRPRKLNLNLDAGGAKVHVRDLWAQRDMGIFDGSFTVSVPPHGCFFGLAERATN